MKERHLNQPRLAEALGVNQSTISLWLNGKEPGLDNLKALAHVFEFDFLTMLQAIGVIDQTHQYSPQMAEWLRQIDKVLEDVPDPRKREVVVSFLDKKLAHTYAEFADLLEHLDEFPDEQPSPPA